jgi:hypothetical protein
MLSTTSDNIKRFKSKIAGLKCSKRFVRWGESARLAQDLMALLSDLKDVKPEPCLGTELIVSFYKTDNATLGRCDDSSGHVGDVYRFDAKDLFLFYATCCNDKDWLEELVVRLNHEDGYGIRDTLVDCAAQYLPEPNLRSMIAKFQTQADKEHEEHAKRHWLYRVESLARQVKDAPLYERTRIAAWGRTPTAACIDISRVYLESGDAQTALSWLERVHEDETFMEDERDKLLLDIHGELGNSEKQKQIAHRIFRRHRSTKSLQDLLDVVGRHNQESIVAEELASITANSKLALTDAAFLMEINLINEAESYILNRADQLNGDHYYSLLPLAQTLEAQEKYLSATLIYRALLESILKKARSKIYHHGVRYLRKLDLLAKTIQDWQEFDNHDQYSKQLREKHFRKKSFWARYE